MAHIKGSRVYQVDFKVKTYIKMTTRETMQFSIDPNIQATDDRDNPGGSVTPIFTNLKKAYNKAQEVLSFTKMDSYEKVRRMIRERGYYAFFYPLKINPKNDPEEVKGDKGVVVIKEYRLL